MFLQPNGCCTVRHSINDFAIFGQRERKLARAAPAPGFCPLLRPKPLCSARQNRRPGKTAKANQFEDSNLARRGQPSCVRQTGRSPNAFFWSRLAEDLTSELIFDLFRTARCAVFLLHPPCSQVSARSFRELAAASAGRRPRCRQRLNRPPFAAPPIERILFRCLRYCYYCYLIRRRRRQCNRRCCCSQSVAIIVVDVVVAFVRRQTLLSAARNGDVVSSSVSLNAASLPSSVRGVRMNEETDIQR